LLGISLESDGILKLLLTYFLVSCSLFQSDSILYNPELIFHLTDDQGALFHRLVLIVLTLHFGQARGPASTFPLFTDRGPAQGRPLRFIVPSWSGAPAGAPYMSIRISPIPHREGGAFARSEDVPHQHVSPHRGRVWATGTTLAAESEGGTPSDMTDCFAALAMTAMGPPPVAAGDDEIYRSLIAGRHGGLPLLGPDLRRGDVKSP